MKWRNSLALRVCDFAKELKISSSALMKHLSDLGVEVRHHMNYLDDEVMDKIRNKFRSEAENLKRIDLERKRIQDQLRESKQESIHTIKQKNESPQQVVENPFVKPAQADIEKPQTQDSEKDNTRVRKEEFTEPRTPSQDNRQSNYRGNDFRPPREGYNQDNRQSNYRGNDSRPPREGYNQDNRQSNYRGNDSRPPREGYNQDNRQSNYRGNDSRPPREGYNQDNRQSNYRGNDSRPPREGYNQDNRQSNYRGNDSRPPREGYNQDNRQSNYRGNDSRPPREGYNQDNRQSNYRGNDSRPPREGYNQDNRQSNYRGNNDSRPPRGNAPYDKGKSDFQRRPAPAGSVKPTFDKVLPVKATDELKQEVRVFGKTKKVTIDDLGDKSKHLQAKLKNTKKKKGVAAPIEIDEVAIEKNIKIALAGNKKKKKYKKEEKKSNILDGDAVISISEFTSVSELAKIMDRSPSEIITKFFQMGKMVSINQRLDRESLELICDEFNFDVQFEDEYGSDLIEDVDTDEIEYEEYSRPPVVTIMGHVDHGKTSILDYIRKTKVVAGESGGITQHIGAYQVSYRDHKITFLDTPGHEAFTAMRARGANITDVAIIVVAANDGVKPQTIEAIDHARAAGVTMIIAINKIDLHEANIDRTIANMLEQNVYLEGWGGDVLWAKTSAATGEGMDELLELILLACEMKELKAKYNVPGKGVVIEARKDPRMGSMSTILLQEGSLKKGDNIVCGATYGHVRRMENERGQEITQIGPSDICVLYGLGDVPKAGDIINQVSNEKIARQISTERLLIRQEREKYQTTTNLTNLFSKIKENEMSELRLIIKADTDGSVEAICDALQKLSNEEVMVNVIRKSVGGIMEADVNLASASDAIILGFHVRANAKAKKLAEELSVEVKLYSIIFDAIEDIKSAMSGMLAPEIREKFIGQVLVKQTFKIKKVGTVAGCFVEKGSAIKTGLARVFRDDVKIHEGRIASLKHFDLEVNEIKAGSDCGITLKDFNDVKENDIIEIYLNEEFKRDI